MRPIQLLVGAGILATLASTPYQRAFALSASEKGNLYTACLKGAASPGAKLCCTYAGGTWATNTDGSFRCALIDDRRVPGRGTVGPRNLTITPSR
jgi:hypothetical protein